MGERAVRGRLFQRKRDSPRLKLSYEDLDAPPGFILKNNEVIDDSFFAALLFVLLIFVILGENAHHFDRHTLV